MGKEMQIMIIKRVNDKKYSISTIQKLIGLWGYKNEQSLGIGLGPLAHYMEILFFGILTDFIWKIWAYQFLFIYSLFA